MADELGQVLEHLHESGRRWRTLRAEGEEWFDEERAAEAFRRSIPRGSVTGMQGTPEPVDRDPVWKAWLRQPDQSRVDFGGPHQTRYLVITDGDRVCTSHPQAGYNIRDRGGRPELRLGPAENLLRPFRLPATLDLQVVGRTTFLGREVVTVRGWPRAVAEPLFPWSFPGADEVELWVDAERGVVLWLELRAAGAPFRRTAMTKGAFDEDLAAGLFAFPVGPVPPLSVAPLPGGPPR